MKLTQLLEVVDKKLMLSRLERELRSNMHNGQFGRTLGRQLTNYDVQREDERLSVRYWGDWVVPEDEEDDGDYDWKVLSIASKMKLKNLIAKFEKDNNCKVDVQSSEKCWLEFSIK